MSQFQSLWSKLSDANGQLKEFSKRGEHKEDQNKKGQDGGKRDEPATVKAASAISQNVLDHRLTKSEKVAAWQNPTDGDQWRAHSARIVGPMSAARSCSLSDGEEGLY